MGCTVQRNLQNLREPMFKSYALPSQPNKGIIPAGASVVGTRVAAAAAALECARSKLNLSIHFLARTVRRSVGPSVGRSVGRESSKERWNGAREERRRRCRTEMASYRPLTPLRPPNILHFHSLCFSYVLCPEKPFQIIHLDFKVSPIRVF